MSRWAVVVPSNRPERLAAFVSRWEELFAAYDADLIVVADEPPWEGVPACIPRRTGNIRSWGFFLAWKSGARFVLSLDDDVSPDGDPFAEYEAGFARSAPVAPYLSVGALVSGAGGVEMRGFPFASRWEPVGIQYGGWAGVPDLDAVTQITVPPVTEAEFAKLVIPVPRGVAATCCAMNFAFRADLAPLSWQHSTRERWGDIWCGLYQKRALDAAGLAMLVNGRALVQHDRASSSWANLNSEAAGMGPNEGLWEALEGTGPDSPVEAWRDVTDRAAAYFAGAYDAAYAADFVARRDGWLSLFEE